jgi:hypothetical protein
MYKYALIIVLGISLYSCDIRGIRNKKDVQANNPGEEVIKDSTTVEVMSSDYNFGKVTDGEKVEYSFKFKNTGSHPLIIRSAQPSCGCTIAEKPDQPVMPGETGFIKAVFNSAGRVGDVHKEIVVRSNASPHFPTLKILGEVEAKEKNQ